MCRGDTHCQAPECRPPESLPIGCWQHIHPGKTACTSQSGCCCKLLVPVEAKAEASHHMQVVTNAQNVTEGMRTALAVRIKIRPMCLLLCAGTTGLVLCSEGALVICLSELIVFMQLEGSRTPGSDIAVAAATVRGSRSFGMICSAQDLGWMEAGNGLAVKLPQGMELGDSAGA